MSLGLFQEKFMSLPKMPTDGLPSYRLIESNPRITILLLDNGIYFDEAVKTLQSMVAASRKLSPTERRIGVMVLPKGSHPVDRKKLHELSNSRIAVRISEVDDLQVASQVIEQGIMQQYTYAKNHMHRNINA